MSWLRKGMSNSEARAALAQSGNQFDDDRILSQVPVWRRGVVRRQAEEARYSGAPTQENWERAPWESDFYNDAQGGASVTALDTSGNDFGDSSLAGVPDEAA